MSIQRDPDGRRSVRVECEVPGTPEQVWQAIATGPGISAWFVPTTVDGKVGGETVSDFGGGMVSKAKITAYDPPRRFAAEAPGWSEGMPPVATEWTIEAQAGGTCRLRVVHSMFASSDDWDSQIEHTQDGWPSYFVVLRRYLTRFAGEACAQVQAMAMSSSSCGEAWQTLSDAMQLDEGKPGQSISVEMPGGVAMSGKVQRVARSGEHHTLHVAPDAPAPGTLFVGAFPCGGAMASLQAYFYGDRAERVAADVGPHVQKWLQGVFPAEAASG